MIRFWLSSLLVFSLSANAAFTESNISSNTTRGAMLYENHCVQCHTRAVHWREKKLATDWDSLTAQVDRWQRNASLEWDQHDIKDVSHYLNSVIYHYP